MPALDDDACWNALRARDARFDGRFYTGVSSTGIYCRPVCRVRTPRRENCRFFADAAQAEQAGFRPCLRCRPELAPGAAAWSAQDAGAILAREAARAMDAPGGDDAVTGVAAVARRLGVSDRHLRRVFESAYGVSPLQYLQTRRLLVAKQLLADTQLPVSQVAQLAGFQSLRRFNAALAARYGLNPTRLRREGAPRSVAGQGVRLGLRPPYDAAAMLGFFAQRRIEGMDVYDTATCAMARTLAIEAQGRWHRGWLRVRIDATDRHVLVLHASESLQPVLPLLIRRVRDAFDLDADPLAIDGALQHDFPGGAGLRVPGAFCGFELAVRAVLGQQVSVAAARTFAQRLVQRWGEPIDAGIPGLERLFPTPAALAAADGDALGALGIVRQRQQAIRALAQATVQRQLVLQPGADSAATIAALAALPGIGPWTAHYIAMRALRWPDAFPTGDVALQQALGLRGLKQPARLAEALSQRWRPWRSYAVLRAWAGHAAPHLGVQPDPQKEGP